MPYITQDARMRFAEATQALAESMEQGITPGDLNYLMSTLAKLYVDRKGLNYTHINDVMGVFASAQAEFYRRVAVPYEDKKIAENGDL